jgi:hydroxyethylthiazole kinase-like uncharacterized protein yjeF
MEIFDPLNLKDLFRPAANSGGEDNGQITIIGGSSLFHGAPILALKTASRVVDMVFFSSPEAGIGKIAEEARSKLMSFIWVPWEEVGAYIEKSNAVLIGPGFMRYKSEQRTENKEQSEDIDKAGKITRGITERLLERYLNKKWVIDAGSLQVMDPEWIPSGAIITPNRKEFELLFGERVKDLPVGKAGQESGRVEEMVKKKAQDYDCVIVLKGPETIVASDDGCVIVRGGNAGMTKGGTGDVLAGLTVALLAKNEPFLAAASASYIAKVAADELFKKVGVNYNADDLADAIPETLRKLTVQ